MLVNDIFLFKSKLFFGPCKFLTNLALLFKLNFLPRLQLHKIIVKTPCPRKAKSLAMLTFYTTIGNYSIAFRYPEKDRIYLKQFRGIE